MRKPQTHDYATPSLERRFWIKTPIEGGEYLDVLADGYDVKTGDYIIIQLKNGGTTRYLVERVSYENFPRHKTWTGRLKFAPRLTPPPPADASGESA